MQTHTRKTCSQLRRLSGTIPTPGKRYYWLFAQVLCAIYSFFNYSQVLLFQLKEVFVQNEGGSRPQSKRRCGQYACFGVTDRALCTPSVPSSPPALRVALELQPRGPRSSPEPSCQAGPGTQEVLNVPCWVHAAPGAHPNRCPAPRPDHMLWGGHRGPDAVWACYKLRVTKLSPLGSCEARTRAIPIL